MKKFIFNLYRNELSCIRCGKNIQPIPNPPHLDEHDEHKEFNDIESIMIDDAVCGKISANYGSGYDSDIFALGVCDDCVKILLEEHKLVYIGNYMNCSGELDDFEKEQFEKYGPIKRKQII